MKVTAVPKNEPNMTWSKEWLPSIILLIANNPNTNTIKAAHPYQHPLDFLASTIGVLNLS